MPNYANGKIYRLECRDPICTDFYVGSTVQPLGDRLSRHKSKPARGVLEVVEINGGWECWRMTLIEPFPCKTKLELLTREDYWQTKLNPTMNKLKALPVHIQPTGLKTDSKEWAIEHYRLNRESLLAYSNAYYARNRERKKAYYLANRDRILAQQRARRAAAQVVDDLVQDVCDQAVREVLAC